eukprot:scaffold5529_cov117-Cylindrotheca_fusiformis.AAC.21
MNESASQRNRRYWHLSWHLLVLQLLSLTHVSSGQRVIASLGTKLRKFRKSDDYSKRYDDGFIVEGEEDTNPKLSFLYSFHGNPYALERVVALWIGAVTLIIFTLYKSTERNEQEDDIVVQGDSVKAMGGLEAVDLGFSGLYLDLKVKRNKKNGEDKKILLDGSIRGRAQPGRMLAIMGPSGAGKSTILHALAGRVKESSKIHLEGNRYLNGKQLTGDSMLPCAFVEQENNFFPHMTVRETLSFRVDLKLGSRISKKARAVLVDNLIEELGLEKAAGTIVGDSKVRGISGGERRRLAIACELISSPSILFLDEPTSGLDSTAATSLVETLRSLADKGKTVVAVIHQPSQHVFAAFDDLLLVSEGKQMYFGKVSSVRQYMDTYAHIAEQEMGTAEHILGGYKLDMPHFRFPSNLTMR